MTLLEQLLPQEGKTVDVVLSQIHAAQRMPLPIGAEATLQFCADLSQRLLQDERAKAFPELAALGFWLRAASVRRMLQDYLPVEPQTIRTPLGVVFQLPPGNVPTLFLYGAVISLLCGNVTVVRLSRTDTPSRMLVVELIGACLSAAPEALRQRLILLRYEPDDVVTSALSMACDVRLVWGGDTTVAHIRALALPVGAQDIGFGDRFSSSALNAEAYLNADAKTRTNLVHHFYNDMFWFDQFACASPRLLVWIGTAAVVDQASRDFYERLAQYAAGQQARLVEGSALAKLTMAYLALHDLPVTRYQVHSPALTVIDLADLSALSSFKPVTYGFGLLLAARLDALNDLASYAERRDQTLTLWGFPEKSGTAFAVVCAGRGYDRIVPVGQALDFSPIWDGHNLFAAMTRLVQVL